MDVSTWEALDPRAAGLAEARLALHHAIQPVAAVGQALLPKAADDSQQSLVVDTAGRWLGAVVAGGALRAGLDPRTLTLLLCDGAGAPLARLPLQGKTLADGLAFLRAELERRGPAAHLVLPSHPDDFPSHPLGAGAPFQAGDAAARATLASLFADTRGLLAGLESPPRLWPHHFDLAVTVKAPCATIALGVSPGEGAAGQPYWYGTISPPLDPGTLPRLEGGGRWRTEGWTGAELPLERLEPGAARQRGQVTAFFHSALIAVGAIGAVGPDATASARGP